MSLGSKVYLLMAIVAVLSLSASGGSAQGLKRKSLAIVPIQSIASRAMVPRIVLVEATERLVTRVSDLDSYAIVTGFGSVLTEQDIQSKGQSGDICAAIARTIRGRREVDRILCTFVDNVTFPGGRHYRSLIGINTGLVQLTMTGRLYDYNQRTIISSFSAVGSSRVKRLMFAAGSGLTLLSADSDYLSHLRKSVLDAVDKLELFFL